MLELTVTTTFINKKKNHIRGRMYYDYDASEITPRLICQLERQFGDFSVVSALPMPIALNEPLATTVARALTKALCEHDLPSLSLERIQSISIVGRSFKTEVLEASVWNLDQRLVGKTGHWHFFDGRQLSIWQIVMHAICEIAFGGPLVAIQSQIPSIAVHRAQDKVYCMTRDLPAEQRRVFEVLHCLSAPIKGVLAPDACPAIDIDAFMCNHFDGYRYSEKRKRFLLDVNRETGT